MANLYSATVEVPEFAMTMGALLFRINTEGNWQYGSAWKNIAGAKRHLNKIRKCGVNTQVLIVEPAEASKFFDVKIARHCY